MHCGAALYKEDLWNSGETGMKDADELPARIDAVLAENDVERAVALVEEAGRALFAGQLRSIPLERISAWLERVRPYVQDRPWLLYYQAWVWTAQRRQALAGVALARAERLFAAQPESDEQRHALALTKLARGVVAERDGNFPAARAAFAGARDLLHGEAQLEPWIDPADADRWRARDASGAASFYLEAIAAQRAAGEAASLARSLNNLALELIRRGEPTIARRAAQECVELKRAIETEASLANSLNTLGMAERLLGLYDAARTTFGECLDLAARAHPSVHAYALTNLAEVERDAGSLDAAEDLYSRSLAEKRALKDSYGLAYGLRSWSAAKRRAGDIATARRLIDEALAARDPLVDPTETAQLRTEHGLVLLACGETAAGRTALEEARLIAEEIDVKVALALCRIALAQLDGDAPALEAALADARHYRFEPAIRADVASIVDRGSRGPDRATREVRAWILGEFRIEIGGRPVELASWRSKRAAQLVRALAAHRRAVPRDELLEWLWPSGDGTTDKLNAAVNAARRGLEEAGGPGTWLVREGERYRIADLSWVDADELQRRYLAGRDAFRAGDRVKAREELRAAIQLANRGEPLADDRYTEWAASERARVLELAQIVRESFAKNALELGHADEALLAAVAASSVEPSRESAHRLLIRAHLARGDRASAAKALVACRDALRRELGVAPSRETESLLREAS